MLQPSHPSLHIHTSDRVFVGDCNHRISVFTSEGQFLTSFGQDGPRPGEFDQWMLVEWCMCVIFVTIVFVLHCYSEFYVSPHMYYFSLYVSTLLQ